MNSQIIFEQLNRGWTAEPNAPELELITKENDVIIEFFLDSFVFNDFSEGDRARITFHKCLQYRIGPPNDEGFFIYGQSRYKKYGVKWGEFYLVHNSDWKDSFPDSIVVGENSENLKHYLFYFKDETFECIANSYDIKFV